MRPAIFASRSTIPASQLALLNLGLFVVMRAVAVSFLRLRAVPCFTIIKSSERDLRAASAKPRAARD